jgi:transcriptional regulator
LGKISVGVRRMINGLRTKIRRANTINVYGRLRASLTIHIESPAAAMTLPERVYAPT